MVEGGIGDGLAAYDAGKLADSALFIQLIDLCIGAVVADGFADEQMVIGKGGDLCLVGHAERLAIGGELLELFADPARG